MPTEAESHAYRKENQTDSARARRRAYMRSDKGRAANRKAQENYRENHPEKVKKQSEARSKESSNGKTADHKCASCDKPAKHKHHPSYNSKEVKYLCHEHHVKTHHPKSNLGKSEFMEQLHGGAAAGMSPKDFEPTALRIGAEHEKEHTSDAMLAQEIAMDHLAEDPKYYVKLEEIEKATKQMKKSDILYAGPGNSWLDRFRGTPLYAEALQCERDSLDAIGVEPAKAIALDEKYSKKKQELIRKLLDFEMQQEKQREKERKMMEKSMTAKIAKTAKIATANSELSKAFSEIQSLDVDGELKKALNESASGEMTSGAAAMGAESLSASAAASSGQELNSDAKNGMPSADAGQVVQFSEDDVAVESQLKAGDPASKPLASDATGGASDLARSSEQQMMSKAHPDSMIAAQTDRAARHEQAIRESTMRKAAAGADPVQMRNGMIVSNVDDEFIAKAQNAQGYITPEPTLGIPESLLQKSRCCHLCKSAVPAFLSVCPECGGGDAAVAAQASHSGVVMHKSVRDSIRPKKEEDLYLPNGLK